MKGIKDQYLVRVSLHTSRQKFGKFEQKKLAAWNNEGIVLSLSENKALFAIQKLLDNTNYEGNLAGKLLTCDDNNFKYNGKVPRLEFTPAFYLEAYGLKRKKTARGYYEFNSHEREQAIKALHSLSDKKFRIVYERTNFEDKNGKAKKTIDVIITESNLIHIMWGIFGMTEAEKRKYDNNSFTEEELLERATYGVELSPILVDQINGYFILIPNNLFDEIKGQLPKGKYSQYIPLFIEWLIVTAEIQRRAKTGWKVEINFKKLATKLRMDKMIQKRKWKQIREKLQECYEVAAQLGYITEYYTDDGIHDSKEVFHLNPEKSKTKKKSDVTCSTQKKSNLYPKKERSLPKKGALSTQKRSNC